MKRSDILAWLREEDGGRLQALWREADRVRRDNVGDSIHLRGLIEVSNYCVRRCSYCGLRAENRELMRYRMSDEEIMECVDDARAFGYGTVVIQAGEDVRLTGERVADLVRRIKSESALAVSLSLGERSQADLQAWRDSGADRYLLRFETSDRRLYDAIHPPLPREVSDRMAILRNLRRMGYEVGSGVMVGVPGQTYESLANDIATFADLELDMIGVGPFLPNPATPFGAQSRRHDWQVPNTELMTYKVMALSRLVCPWANIPSTTALATVNTLYGRELGFARGANVVMPILTPPEYRRLYEIYPSKACGDDTASDCQHCMRVRIASIGRTVGTGRGDSKRKMWKQSSVGLRRE